MKKILIIGAGWLGLPFAQQLSALKHQVIVTRRSTNSLREVPLAQESKAILDLANDDAAKKVRELVDNNAIDIVVGSFPPGFRKGSGEEYAHQWQKIIDGIKDSAVQKVIMVSSTTVYPNQPVEMREDDATLAKANSESDLFSDKARVMLQAEQSLLDSGKNFTILRLSGLFGPNRPPARFVPHLKQISSRAPANMLHLDDAINALLFALSAVDQQVLNVSTPTTVDKATFYQAALESAQLDVDFPPVVAVEDKRIVVDKLLQSGFQFQYQSTLDAL